MSKYHTEIPDLGDIGEYRFENIFKVYTDNSFYFYNILKTINIPDDLQDSIFYRYKIPNPMSWHVLSNILYDTTDLWWLIVLVNKIDDPVTLPESGKVIKVIRPNSITQILKLISDQL